MKALSCINPEIPFLQPEDKGMTALGLLEELRISEIPLVDKDVYLGLVTELDLLDYECIDGEIRGIGAELKKPFIYENDHLFDCVARMASDELTVLPVLSLEDKYLGCIDQKFLIRNIADAEGFKSAGGVLELEMALHDYSMADISRHVEANDLKVLHCRVTSSPDTNRVRVTLKLNHSDLTQLIRTLERFNYTITASFQQEDYEEEIRKRYEGFLKYLNP